MTRLFGRPPSLGALVYLSKSRLECRIDQRRTSEGMGFGGLVKRGAAVLRQLGHYFGHYAQLGIA
jgi:hypothetical protein